MILPFEKEDRALFYHYYFKGLSKPLIIQAYDKQEASRYVLDHISRVHDRTGIEVIDMRITSAIFGETEYTEKDKVYVWCGKKYSPSGWMLKEEFQKRKIYENATSGK